MKSRILASIALVVLTLTAAPLGGQSFRAPVPLGELILDADAIASGEIVAVGKADFTFRIERTLTGEIGSPQVQVQKFQAPKTSPRWAPYQVGQALILFLEAVPCTESEDDAAWRILGRIGEGEIPLAGGYAYFPGRSVAGAERAYHRLYGTKVYIQRLDRETTISAIEGYRDCFEEPRDSNSPGSEIACDPERLASYAESSSLHAQLAQEAKGMDRQ